VKSATSSRFGAGTAATVFRRKKPKELTQLHLEQYRQASSPWPPERDLPGRPVADAELNAFIAELKPNERFSYGEADVRRHRQAAQLASRPLTTYLEGQARLVGRLTLEAHRNGGGRSEESRAIGQALALQGGAFLMVLVALRAPYILDPDWQAKHAELVCQAREAGAVVSTSAGGPIVRLIERQWSRICSWES
jgi:hypothetical protein